MKTSKSRTEPALTGATIIHFFLAVFGSSNTLVFFDENNWKITSSASALDAALNSGELRIPSAVAALCPRCAAAVPFVVWLASCLCEARLGDPFTDLLAGSCCLTVLGAGLAGFETRGRFDTGGKMASSSADCTGDFAVLPEKRAASHASRELPGIAAGVASLFRSMKSFCCLTKAGTDEPEPETRSLSTGDSGIASRSADCLNGFAVSSEERAASHISRSTE
ncbi:MAG: hypothetical protein WAL45_14425 [Terracidiphilus sp.]